MIYDSALLAVLPASVAASTKLLPSDGFPGSSVDAGKWNSTIGSPTVSGGVLNLACTAAYTGVVRTTAAQDARGKELTGRVQGTSRSMVAADETRLILYSSANGIATRAEIGVYAQNLWFGVYSGGSIVHQSTWPSSLAYDSTRDSLKLAVSAGGLVSAWYGPDGVSWTQLGASYDISAWAAAVYVRVDAGNYNGTTGTTAYIDDVNV